mgnify:CR=1 FL=1
MLVSFYTSLTLKLVCWDFCNFCDFYNAKSFNLADMGTAFTTLVRYELYGVPSENSYLSK